MLLYFLLFSSDAERSGSQIKGMLLYFLQGRENCHVCHHGQGWIRSCIFSREEGTVMCVTMDKDGLGVVFSPGKRELSCVSSRTWMD